MMAQEDRDEWSGWSRAHRRVIPEHQPGCYKDPPMGLEVPVGDLEHGAQFCRPSFPIQLLNSPGHSSPRIWTSDVQQPGKLQAGSIQEEIGSGGAGRLGKAGGSVAPLKALTLQVRVFV